jgi:ABC-type proline/glycine betaine transport system substrate-binding protein
MVTSFVFIEETQIIAFEGKAKASPHWMCIWHEAQKDATVTRKKGAGAGWTVRCLSRTTSDTVPSNVKQVIHHFKGSMPRIRSSGG